MILSVVKNLSQFEEKLVLKFNNEDLLLQALTHRSYLNEHPSAAVGHNERLEFLGDAVLELVVTEALYRRFPEKPEGDLTSFRAALVNAKMLAEVSVAIGVNDYLRLSRGEAKDIGRARQYILANTFEALVGAIYLDQEYAAVERFITHWLLPRVEEVITMKLYKDPKSLFQEEAQERVGVTPTYEVMRESGPDHDKIFVVGIFISEECVAEGEGPSKQIAQEDAARKALAVKGWL